MKIISLVVEANPSLEKSINSLKGCKVELIKDDKLVVLLELEDNEDLKLRFNELEKLEGVRQVSLVFSSFD